MTKKARARSVHKLLAPKYPPRVCLEPTCGKTFTPNDMGRFRCSDACYIKAWMADGSLSKEKGEKLLATIREESQAGIAKMRAAVARRLAREEGLTAGTEGGLLDGTNPQDPEAEPGDHTPEQGTEETPMKIKKNPKKTTKAEKAAKAAKPPREKGPAIQEKEVTGRDGKKRSYTVDREHQTASGNPTVSNGDRIAVALRGLDADALGKVAKENKLEERWAKYKKLNPGQQRMNLSNVLRGLVRKGEGATVQGKVIKSLGGDAE